MFVGDPWVIDEILDWALPIATAAGFAGVVAGWEFSAPDAKKGLPQSRESPFFIGRRRRLRHAAAGPCPPPLPER